MKYVIITGADGFIGGKIIKKLIEDSEFGIIAVSSFPKNLPLMIERESVPPEKIIMMSSEDFLSHDFSEYNITGVVHLAFSRAIFPNQDIASSLDYCMKIYNKIVDSNIDNSIYISSQSVYGDTSELRKENMPVAPNSIYAMAKYGGEKIIEACYQKKAELQHTIIRLDNVIQSQNLVKALCKNAKETGILTLTGGKQVFSYIDVSEVPDAVYALLMCQKKWQPVYNVGADRMQASLIEVAETVKRIAENDGKSVNIDLTESDAKLWSGMDISLFKNDTGWKPKMDLFQMIKNVYDSI